MTGLECPLLILWGPYSGPESRKTQGPWCCQDDEPRKWHPPNPPKCAPTAHHPQSPHPSNPLTRLPLLGLQLQWSYDFLLARESETLDEVPANNQNHTNQTRRIQNLPTIHPVTSWT